MFAIASKLSAAAAVLVLSAGLTFAQAPGSASSAGAPAAGTKAPGKSGSKKASTPEGIECSAQADTKGLKGKERRSFRSKCISALKKGKSGPKGSGSGSAKS